MYCLVAGINQYESDKPARYASNTNLSSRVAALNPPWNGDQSDAASNAQFQKAMQLTGHEFMEALEYYSNVSLPSNVRTIAEVLLLATVCGGRQDAQA